MAPTPTVESPALRVNVKWLKSFGQGFPDCYNNPKYGDISIHTKGRILSVNSLVLASQSGPLKDIVETKEPANMLEETLLPFSFQSVDSFFYGLYSGELEDFKYSTMVEVFKLCAMFKVDWMEESCLRWFAHNITTEVLLPTITLALEYENEYLLTCCEKLFGKMPLSEIVDPASDEWIDLPLEVTVHILSLANLCMICEIDAFVYALTWVEKNITYSNKELCQDIFECCRLYSLPNDFRESFVYSYISLLSQKLLMAIKYPQMNRWKVKNYPPRKNLQIQSTAEDYFEFSVVVEHSVSLVDIDFNKTFTNAGVLVSITINFTKKNPLVVTLSTDKKIEECYAWFKSEGTEIFPLGADSVVCGDRMRWQNFDVVQTRRLFCSGRVRIGFVLYKGR